MTAIPELDTARLRMVAPTEAHIPGETAFWASARSKPVGGPLPGHRIWRLIALWRGHWVLRGYGGWSLEDRASGAHLGFAGIWHPGEWPEPELGYHLFAAAEGQGFATEAARATLAFAYNTLGWTTLMSLIDPANAASQRVARRLGAVNTRDTFRATPDDAEAEIWRYPGPEAQA